MAPTKDMELCVQGRSLSCGAFQALLFAALRALIDGLGCATFNVGVYNVACGRAVRTSNSKQPGTSADGGTCQPDGAADAGSGLPPGSSERQPPVLARWETKSLFCALSVLSCWAASFCRWDNVRHAVRFLHGYRVVSRGRPHARASDYGGLEVFGHASIGHTDPYRVFEALQAQAQALGVT